ncbi:MAG: hypothetical protein IZT55_02250 [Anaerolineae bacterium]|nr:hypothetical protein [Anaerolineae bacterium]
MIVHEPETIHDKGHTIVCSRIETTHKIDHFPEYLWYRVPDLYSQYLSTHGDAFLMPVLAAAMHFGEHIEVRGAVSPRLAYNLDEYQFLLNFYMPKDVRPITIKYHKFSIPKVGPKGVACSFSGGVDSFFTLKNHLPGVQPILDYQLTHALFINGFDILNEDESKYHRLFSQYELLLRGMSIELLPLQTNGINFILPWLSHARFFAPTLAGCGMVLCGVFKRFYIASSLDYYLLHIRSSSSGPLTDRLLSTDTLDIVHYGAMSRRVEKVEAISDWEPAQTHLRVCGTPGLKARDLNCSRCEKCTRTMIPLYALGKMGFFKTFSKPFKLHSDTVWWARKFDPRNDNFTHEVFPFVKKHQPGNLPWLYLAALLGTIRYWIIKILPGFIKKWLMRYGYFVDKLKQENAFDDPEILKLIDSFYANWEKNPSDYSST